jgi:hypothetical protein
MRKRVLVVGMLNSVHTAKWLKQFKNRELDIYLFPSAYFRKLHPQIEELIESNSTCNFNIIGPIQLFGYFDYLMNRILSRMYSGFSRSSRLSRTIRKTKPQIIHALEFQHSGYLCLEHIEKYGKDFELITTNWGSDIYHFQHFAGDREKIIQLLGFSDKYSAECNRDVLLAHNLGFAGEVLPVVPNSGGFDGPTINKKRVPTSARKLILIKGYEGYFGRTSLILKNIPQILEEFQDLHIFLYSVTEDIEEEILGLRSRYPMRLNFSTVRVPLEYSRLQELFDLSRVYIGCSISDGISTSFLEALVSGAYPIQTSTSCANEWVKKGAMASLVPLEANAIYRELVRVIHDNHFLDMAQLTNNEISNLHLLDSKICELAQKFY